jgi:hypothetical protein
LKFFNFSQSLSSTEIQESTSHPQQANVYSPKLVEFSKHEGNN